MSEREPTGHPVVVIAISSFIGGLLAGSNNAGTLGIVALPLIFSFASLALFKHIDKKTWDHSLGILLGLSTTIPLPCGFIGFLIGKSLWGT